MTVTAEYRLVTRAVDEPIVLHGQSDDDVVCLDLRPDDDPFVLEKSDFERDCEKRRDQIIALVPQAEPLLLVQARTVTDWEPQR